MGWTLTRPLAVAAVTACLLGGVGVAAGEADAATTTRFANCTQLNHVYRHGVGRPGARDKVRGTTKPVTNFYVSASIYKQNSRLDRDHNGIACERR